MVDLSSSPGLTRTPLFDWHVEHRARMTPFAGWEMPLQYEGIAAEHMAVRTGVGQFDLMHMAVLGIEGPNARAAVSWSFTNDIGRLAVGRAQYSLLADESGVVLDDVMVYWVDDERFLVVANAVNYQCAAAAIRSRCAAMDASFRDHSDDLGVLAVQGPFSREVLEKAGLDAGSLRRFDLDQRAEVAGVGVTLSRTGYTGEDGFELIVPRSAATDVWREMLAAGSGWSAKPVGLGARDTLRVEAGLALYGHELGPSITAFEAGLGRVVSFNHKFHGRAALLGQSAARTRRLVGLRLSLNRVARPGSVVRFPADERGVGVITSGAFSFSARASIAMALVPATWVPGAEVAVDIRGHRVAATIVDLPFHRANRRKARSA